MQFTRRDVLLGAGAAAAALAPRVARAQAGNDALYQAAKKEGQLSWYSGTFTQPVCEEMGRAFTKLYPGITVNSIKTTSQVAFQRLIEDIKGGGPQCDVFTTTDVGHMTYLIGKSLLTKYTAAAASGLEQSVREFGNHDYYQVTWIGQIVILYNTAKVTAADLPKDWPDLTDPKWKDKMAVGSPNYSGIIGVWTVAMEQKYGWEYFEKLSKLNPLIGRSSDDPTTVLNSGERIVAAGNPSTALRSAALGNPLAVNYPTGGTLVDYSPTAIIKGAKNPNAAKLWMEFLASKEFSEVLTANFEQPLRPDVPPPKGAKSLAEYTRLSPSIEEIEKQLPIDQKKWRATFNG